MLAAIARGDKRMLIVLATGTGKTMVAFQIIWRLLQAKKVSRVLFLADRDILVSQPFSDDFSPLGGRMTRISNRAMQDVEQQNFDSAITKSRTLLEETFCYVIEKKGETPSDSGDMMKLYRQVRELYNMHTDGNTDRRINTLLSGLNSIVSAISEMRNKDSDAHGVGANRIAIDEHHARLFVNSAMTMADFILSVAIKNNAI